MNHLKQIAAKLPEYGIDAMLLNSEPGEYYAVGFHGEGNVVVTAESSALQQDVQEEWVGLIVLHLNTDAVFRELQMLLSQFLMFLDIWMKFRSA